MPHKKPPIAIVSTEDDSEASIQAGIMKAGQGLHVLDGKPKDHYMKSIVEIQLPEAYEKYRERLSREFNTEVSLSEGEDIRVLSDNNWVSVALIGNLRIIGEPEPDKPKPTLQKTYGFIEHKLSQGNESIEVQLERAVAQRMMAAMKLDSGEGELTTRELLDHYDELPEGFEVDVKYFKQVCKALESILEIIEKIKDPKW